MPLALEGRAPGQVPSRLTGPEWAGEMLGMFPPDPLISEGPSPLSSLLLPLTMPLGPMWPEGALDSRGPDPEAQWASWG